MPYQKTPDTVATTMQYYLTETPFVFDLLIMNGDQYSGDIVNEKGAVITDTQGNVLGLEGAYFNSFDIILGFPGMVRFPPIISINTVLELVNHPINLQTAATNPVLFYYSSSPFDGQIGNYSILNSIVQQDISKMGNPIPVGSLPQNYEKDSEYPAEISDGPCVTVVFVQNVPLTTAAG
jgi:hypothetical protein